MRFNSRHMIVTLALLLVFAQAAGCVVTRNLVNVAPAIGGNNGRFVCDVYGNTTGVCTWTISALPASKTAGLTALPSPATLAVDPASAPGAGKSYKITITGTDYSGAAATETLTWADTDHTAQSTTKYFKTVTALAAAVVTGEPTAPGSTTVGYNAITRVYVPPYTQWVDFTVVTTAISIYVDFTATSPTTTTSAYTWPTGAYRSLGIAGGNWLYFGLSGSAASGDRVHVQCYR